MKKRIAECINILGNFLAKRDISSLTTEEIKRKYGIEQVDIMVLFGGSIICGGDVFAEAIKNKIAKKYIIAGGAGHTTETLREKVHMKFPYIETAGLTEAEIFQSYLENIYGLQADFLECNSTNCGNNITYLLDLIREKELPFHSIILLQDAAMQCSIALLMGEIPRLSDNMEGYGPKGKGYIAHVDIPIEVEKAFLELKKEYAGLVREANPLYASI